MDADDPILFLSDARDSLRVERDPHESTIEWRYSSDAFELRDTSTQNPFWYQPAEWELTPARVSMWRGLMLRPRI